MIALNFSIVLQGSTEPGELLGSPQHVELLGANTSLEVLIKMQTSANAPQLQLTLKLKKQNKRPERVGNVTQTS